MKTAVVTGGSSGLGREIVNQLSDMGMQVYNMSLETQPAVSKNEIAIACDVNDQYSVRDAVYRIPGVVSILINCAGVNHIDWIENLHIEDWDKVMNTNARSIMLMTQQLLPDLKSTNGTICNIVSNASHMPMTNSLVYNASKGAAHIMTLQMARELTKRYGITVFGVSPARLAGTGMSRYIDDRVTGLRGWTKEQADEYQRAALVTGKEIPPSRCAEFITWLLSEKERHEHLSGCVIPYGA